jgi:signal transduction histidine kinase
MATLGNRSPVLVDTVVAAIALVAVQLEIWIWWVVSEEGPKPVASVLALAMTVPLVWRRSRPVASFVALQSVHAVWLLVAVPQGSLVPFLIELLALFSFAQATPPRVAFAGLGATVGLEIYFVAQTTNDFADYMFILAFVAAAWATGQAVRARQLRADALFEETVRLEVEKEERAREATEAERARIARELHDIVSHAISVMVVQAAAAEQVLATDPRAAQSALRAVQQAGRGARLELRRMLGLMRATTDAPQLDPQPHVGRLDELMSRFADAGLTVDLHVNGNPPEIPAGVGLAAYRVVQEGLTNAVKHGCDKRADVTVDYGTDAMTVEVVNRVAAPVREAGTGFGLVGMRERLELYGGELTYEALSDGRFRLSARLPYAEVNA